MQDKSAWHLFRRNLEVTRLHSLTSQRAEHSRVMQNRLISHWTGTAGRERQGLSRWEGKTGSLSVPAGFCVSKTTAVPGWAHCGNPQNKMTILRQRPRLKTRRPIKVTASQLSSKQRLGSGSAWRRQRGLLRTGLRIKSPKRKMDSSR